MVEVTTSKVSMSDVSGAEAPIEIEQVAQDYLRQGDYPQAAVLLEQAIDDQPEAVKYYLSLGLTYLLLGEEESAQTTWLYGLSQSDEETLPLWTAQLLGQLDTTAQTQAKQEKFETSWLLRKHLREISPDQINNLLALLQLELQLNKFHPDVLINWQVAEHLQAYKSESVNIALLFQVVDSLLETCESSVLSFVEACLHFIKPSTELASRLIRKAYDLGDISRDHTYFATQILELVLTLQPRNQNIVGSLVAYYKTLKLYQDAVRVAEQQLPLLETHNERFVGTCLLMNAYLGASTWSKIPALAEQHQSLLTEICQQQPTNLDLRTLKFLISDTAFILYLEDDLAKNRQIQNWAAQLFDKNMQANCSFRENYTPKVLSKESEKIKIGFMAKSLYNHSVGWLSRWLFKYLDRQKIDISIFLLETEPSDTFFARWFAPCADRVYACDYDLPRSATMIADANVDILMDLDAQTITFNCYMLSHRLAPIQATWLGWDATGIPTVDYFIADPHVLPVDAQAHYQESIWRLPNTYIAVEGFETDVPTRRRETLNIPADAIIYYCGQVGAKRHPDMVRLQMQILKQVPNSYLLVKGRTDEQTLKDLFDGLAEAEGVCPDRLRFLPHDANEFIHRANLQIADVVLDTYPYNGATTTLEALWMGIPLVTQAGQQFTARYSYSFLTNAGVSEGIAWSSEDYVNWGVRYGTDARLRRQVAWKLRQSRHTSPLWNPRQFARDMENAWQQMWQIHIAAKT
jgi:predicted O-linked N-acetylglucosamine transferase (SPINDLY family)